MISFFDSSTGTMQFAISTSQQFAIQNAVFSFHYQLGQQQIVETSRQLAFHLIHEMPADQPGLEECVVSSYSADSQAYPIRYILQIGSFPDEGPVVWRLGIENLSNTDLRMKAFHLLEIPDIGVDGVLYRGRLNALRFFSQGWQSWSHSASYGIEDRMVSSNLWVAQEPLCYDHGTPRPRKKGRFTSDFVAVLQDQESRQGVLLGFLSQQQQFGAISVDLHDLNSLRLWAKGDDTRIPTGQRMTTDWAILQTLPENGDVFSSFAQRVRVFHGITKTPEVYAGWCSWYYYYQKISQEIIQENLERISGMREQVPLSLVQIDDGYQEQVGDWRSFSPDFPHGVAPLAEEIRTAGYLPGLWMAPFIVHPASRLFHDHPQWILRNRRGRPVNAGFIWNVFTTALDLSHPQALDYALQVVQEAAESWKFPYLKLDFLYAAALPGKRYDETRTRAQILRGAFEKLREIVGDQVYLLGCGAPIGPSIGIFDAMRIGADVSGSWLPKYFGVTWPFRGEPNMPSARNAIQNVLTRQSMHRNWWINDPDCLLVREDSELTLEEVQTLASVIGLSGGAFLVSDNMMELPMERLQLIQKVLPIHGFPVSIPDLMSHTLPEEMRVDATGPGGDWQVYAVFNWQDHPVQRRLRLPRQASSADHFWVRSFWDDRLDVWNREDERTLDLPAHGCQVLAIRAQTQQPCYLGGNFHLLQGLEYRGMSIHQGEVRFDFHLSQQMTGWVDLFLPGGLREAVLGTERLPMAEISHFVYRVKLSGQGKITLICHIP